MQIGGQNPSDCQREGRGYWKLYWESRVAVERREERPGEEVGGGENLRTRSQHQSTPSKQRALEPLARARLRLAAVPGPNSRAHCWFLRHRYASQIRVCVEILLIAVICEY